MTRTVAVLAALAIATPTPARAYLKYGVRVGSTVVDVRWDRPVEYFIVDRSVPGVTIAGLGDAVTRAFATWQNVPAAAVQSRFVGTVSSGLATDGRTTFGFVERPDLDRVLGGTSLMLDAETGVILEADVFFNARFTWSTVDGGQPGRVDLQSVALHEIGHLLGLGHSAIGETEIADGGRRVVASGAVMFPIAFAAGVTADRVLQPDDIAGIGDVWPRSSAEGSAGSIEGRVTKNGTGVFGAHVAAMHLETGAIIGNFTLDADGHFAIASLTPGAYVVRVEPLDDVEAESFFSTAVDVDFRVAYAPRVVVVPRGGRSALVTVEVRPK